MSKSKGKKAVNGGRKPSSQDGSSSAAQTTSSMMRFAMLGAAVAVVAVLASIVEVKIGFSVEPLYDDGDDGYFYFPPVVDKVEGLTYDQIRERAAVAPCKNRVDDETCHRSAAAGHCKGTPGWMWVMCPASCDSCELRDPNMRCDSDRIGYSRVPAFKKGSVDALFNILPERFPEYNVTFLSQPPQGLWVAQFDNFLDDQEIEELIKQGGKDLKRSTDQGEFTEDGVQEQVVSKSRTSENSWCMGDCERHPTVQRVMKRIANVTQVPRVNFESFQLLRYQKNQEYTRHHDSSESDNDMLAGPRILTFFLYLSDVEEGGGTQFTDLKPPITMEPKKGSAILWPSVLNNDPTKIDPRAHHRAMPVIKGIKYAANSWIHQYNYRIPNIAGCTGAFSVD